MKLIIASHNLHKILECRTILKQVDELDVYSLLDYPDYEAPEENGATFEENARIKATHAAKSLNELVLADDSGLVVPALGGAPGVHSARYAGEKATDRENRQKLLQSMKQLIDSNRHAHYECCMVLSSPTEEIKVAHGVCEGKIIAQEKGNHGFGYDPLFVKHEYSKTFGEIDEAQKYKISHRRKALDKILIALESLVLQNAKSY